MDQYRIQQRSRRMPAQQIKNTGDDMSNDVEFDDDWSTRMPTSARRFNGYLMFEWRRVAGNLMNCQILIRDIMLQAIPVKAAP